MLEHPTTTNGKVTAPAPQAAVPAPDDETALRDAAIAHIERVRHFKRDLAVFLVGTIALTCVWVLTEYQNADGWPDRFSDSGGTGSWNPWLFWAVLIWGFLVALDGLRTYFRRPTTEAEIQRELDRIRSRR
jgi:hypothetical protein